MNKFFISIIAIFTGLSLSFLTLFGAQQVYATQEQEYEIINECVEVLEPEEKTFSKKIGKYKNKEVYATYKYFESPDGTWTLKIDVNPLGEPINIFGTIIPAEKWESDYPWWWKLLGFKKPIDLPSQIIENSCDIEEEPPIDNPIATPSAQLEPIKQESKPSEAKAPVCTDGNTINLPANPHVLRDGSRATINWFQTEGDKTNIYYKEVNSPIWEHAVIGIKVNNTEKFGSITVNDLDPLLGYTFGIQQTKGCGGGETVIAVIVDDPTPTLFTLSFWEWHK